MKTLYMILVVSMLLVAVKIGIDWYTTGEPFGWLPDYFTTIGETGSEASRELEKLGGSSLRDLRNMMADVSDEFAKLKDDRKEVSKEQLKKMIAEGKLPAEAPEGTMFKYKDKKGKVYYTNTLSNIPMDLLPNASLVLLSEIGFVED